MSLTVTRALKIIEFYAARPRTLTEVTEHLGVHKSTALRLLQTLEREGFARFTDGRYTVGLRMIALANQSLSKADLRTIARPILVAQSEELGHTVHLAQYENRTITYVDKLEGPGALKMQSQVGRSPVLHTAGVAKAILAHLPEDERRAVLRHATYERFTPNTLTTPDQLGRALDIARERGWAEDDAELESFVNCVAAPIFGAGGRVIGSVSITALTVLASIDRLREMVPALRKACARISRE